MRALAFVILIIGFATAALAQTYEDQLARLPADTPPSVRDFIDRRANCNHWLGEEPYDAERAAEIQNSLHELRCDSLANDEDALKQKYAKQSSVLKSLNESREWSPG